jgi:hypothetical protein
VADGVGDKRSDVPPEVGIAPWGIPGGFRRRGDDQLVDGGEGKKVRIDGEGFEKVLKRT